jgi:hypothetical protein
MVWGKKSKRPWFTATLYTLFSVFFLISAMVSVNTYSAVVKAQKDVVLTRPMSSVGLLTNGSLEFSFSIWLENPARYILHSVTYSWYVELDNSSSQTDRVITLGSSYTGPTTGVRVLAHAEMNFSFKSFVSDQAVIDKLAGFVKYSRSLGYNYSLTTIPYTYKFSLMGNLGEFKNDYLREQYLNDLVTIEVSYSSEGSIEI